MKTDKEKFESFFKEMGIVSEEWNKDKYTIITVAQAHFYFDNNNYIGVESDSPSFFKAKNK